MKVRIKPGATVGQDFSFFTMPPEWESVEFEVAGVVDGQERFKLRAPGFGDHERGYGNGAVYAKKADLIPIAGWIWLEGR